MQASGAQPTAAQKQPELGSSSSSRQSGLSSSKQSLPSSSRQSAPSSSKKPDLSSSRQSGPRSSSRQAAACSLGHLADEPQQQIQAPPEASGKADEHVLSASSLKAKQVAAPQQEQPSGQLQPDQVRLAGPLWQSLVAFPCGIPPWHSPVVLAETHVSLAWVHQSTLRSALSMSMQWLFLLWPDVTTADVAATRLRGYHVCVQTVQHNEVDSHHACICCAASHCVCIDMCGSGPNMVQAPEYNC